MSGAAACCCSCPIPQCLSSDTIESICCHACDELLLWCERPGWSLTTQAVGGTPGNLCQWNFTKSVSALPPVQAVYKYHGEYWRCVIPPTTPESLYPIPPRCPPDWDQGAGCYDPSLYLCNGSMSHCNDPSPPVCLCNSTWLTPWRKHVLESDPATKWLVEMTCFKGGAALGGGYGSLYSEFLCVLHREKWWRLPVETCDPEGYLRVPNCTTSECTNACGTQPYVRSQLVPKWWIYACSGVPLFRFDLDTLVATGFMTSAERTAFLTAIALKQQPDQSVLRRIASNRYFQTKDWRTDQQAAFARLDARFPGAGYAACIADPATMPTLGPVVKILWAPYTNPPSVVPLLNRDDATASQLTLNVGAACFIDYPGPANDQAAYYDWAVEQLVYFRAVPGGWQWAGWAAASETACLGMTEEQAILHGCGRGDPGCIEALKGNPHPPPCCVNNTPICDTEVYTPCNGCLPPESCPCGAVPVVGCGPFSPTPVATQCENLVISPICEGIRFAYAQYFAETHLTAGESGCTQSTRYVCGYVAKSYLVEGRRRAKEWAESPLYVCKLADPALPTFHAWPPITEGHYGIAPICDSIIAADGNYSSSDLCCSGFCWDYRYVEGQPTPCVEPVGAKNDCPSTTDCPPHSTAQQIACIGYTPPCP